MLGVGANQLTAIQRLRAVIGAAIIMDARLYLIFRLRFVRCYSWAEVAGALGKCYTEAGVSRMAYNYLESH